MVGSDFFVCVDLTEIPLETFKQKCIAFFNNYDIIISRNYAFQFKKYYIRKTGGLK